MILLVALVMALAQDSPPPQPPKAGLTLPALAEKPQPANEAEKKLDGGLLRVVHDLHKGGIAQANSTAQSLSLSDSANLVRVDIAATGKASVPALRSAIRKRKGRIQADLENHVFALLPAQAIEPLAARHDVFAIAVAATVTQQQR